MSETKEVPFTPSLTKSELSVKATAALSAQVLKELETTTEELDIEELLNGDTRKNTTDNN